MTRIDFLTAMFLGFLAAAALPPAAARADDQTTPATGTMWVYVGTYTQRGSEGIYRADLDLTTGRLDSLRLAAKIVNPSFLAIHPSHRFLYAIGEVGEFAGGKGGAVSALARWWRGSPPCTEAVLAANPEAIVASGMGESRPDWLDDWKRWKQMTAVVRDNLFFVPPELIQRHTPRLLEGAERLCQHLETARSHRPVPTR